MVVIVFYIIQKIYLGIKSHHITLHIDAAIDAAIAAIYVIFKKYFWYDPALFRAAYSLQPHEDAIGGDGRKDIDPVQARSLTEQFLKFQEELAPHLKHLTGNSPKVLEMKKKVHEHTTRTEILLQGLTAQAMMYDTLSKKLPGAKSYFEDRDSAVLPPTEEYAEKVDHATMRFMAKIHKTSGKWLNEYHKAHFQIGGK